MSIRFILTAFLSIGFASVGIAGDGVLEINQTCAIQTGCFSGDAPGFPVSIDGSAGRSYVLTSDLSVSDPNTSGILLETSRISIDFNGFSLTGFSIGTGTADGVTGTGTNGSFAGFTTLSSGTIRGFRAWAVDLGGAEGVRVANMVIEFNGIGGVELGEAAQVVDNRLSSNGGISSDSILLLGEGGLVSRNSIVDSGRYGIFSLGGTLISENVVRGFGESGIVAANFGNSVLNCLIRNDGTGTGLVLGNFSSAYRGNTISNVATSVASGTDVGGNLCQGQLTCP